MRLSLARDRCPSFLFLSVYLSHNVRTVGNCGSTQRAARSSYRLGAGRALTNFSWFSDLGQVVLVCFHNPPPPPLQDSLQFAGWLVCRSYYHCTQLYTCLQVLHYNFSPVTVLTHLTCQHLKYGTIQFIQYCIEVCAASHASSTTQHADLCSHLLSEQVDQLQWLVTCSETQKEDQLKGMLEKEEWPGIRAECQSSVCANSARLNCADQHLKL